MSAISAEYLLRVKPVAAGGYTATIRQFVGTQHPEVRAVLGPVSSGKGETVPAAMLAAICQAQLGQAVREVPRNGC